MRAVHYITIVAALGLIALLYWGGNTIPPKKQTVAEQPASVPEGEAHIHAASFDSILAAARQELPEHAAAEINTIEKKIEAMHDSPGMASSFDTLAKLWQEHKQLPVAAFYHGQKAKLDNSEKNLNFAARFFLNLMQNTSSASVRMWEAQQAVELFERSMTVNPGNDTTKLALAASYIEGTGETMRGVQILLGITRERPDNIPANLMLGRLSIQSGQYEKALGRFETVLKQEPENTEALYFLAEAYKGMGNKEKAIELFEKCKKLVNNPQFSKDIDEYINSFK